MERFNSFHETSNGSPLGLNNHQGFPLLMNPTLPEENRLDPRDDIGTSRQFFFYQFFPDRTGRPDRWGGDQNDELIRQGSASFVYRGRDKDQELILDVDFTVVFEQPS